MLQEVAGNATIHSEYMDEFIAAYTKHIGEWNDEAGMKVYALEMILRVMQKNPKAMMDVAEFKKTMAGFSFKNPFLNDSLTNQVQP